MELCDYQISAVGSRVRGGIVSTSHTGGRPGDADAMRAFRFDCSGDDDECNTAAERVAVNNGGIRSALRNGHCGVAFSPRFEGSC